MSSSAGSEPSKLLLITGIMGICRWGFLYSAEAIRKQEFTDNLPQASVRDLGVILMGAGYEVHDNIASVTIITISYDSFLLS